MADASCSICLDQLNVSVSIPCGHIFCEKCLLDYIETSPDAHKATCPTCRSTFSLVGPNLSTIPKKYHEFILPPTRRVYFDVSNKTNYKLRISELEKQVADMERAQALLRERCDQSMATTRIHAVGQANAMKEAEGARNGMAELRKQLDETNTLCNHLREQNERLRQNQPYVDTSVNYTHSPSFTAPESHPTMRPIRPMPNRQTIYNYNPNNEVEQDTTTNVDHMRRPMVPYNLTTSSPVTHDQFNFNFNYEQPVSSPHEQYASSNTNYNAYPQPLVSVPTQMIPSQPPQRMFAPAGSSFTPQYHMARKM